MLIIFINKKNFSQNERTCSRDRDILFPKHISDHRGGLGLISLQERIRTMGGDFSITSSPGNGCRCTLTIPNAIKTKIDSNMRG